MSSTPIDPLSLVRVVFAQAEGVRDAHTATQALTKAAETGNTAALQALQLIKEFSKAMGTDHEHAAEAALLTLGKLEATKGGTQEKLAAGLETFKHELEELKLGAGHHHHDHDHDHHASGPGVAKRNPQTTSWVKEMKAQAADHWGEKKVIGRVGIVAGSAVGVGVIVHGLHNLKRGAVGYTDHETGEKRKGSIANLVVGAAEVAGGTMLMKRCITGQYGFGPALAR